jgi:hypothetical protein
VLSEYTLEKTHGASTGRNIGAKHEIRITKQYRIFKTPIIKTYIESEDAMKTVNGERVTVNHTLDGNE